MIKTFGNWYLYILRQKVVAKLQISFLLSIPIPNPNLESNPIFGKKIKISVPKTIFTHLHIPYFTHRRQKTEKFQISHLLSLQSQIHLFGDGSITITGILKIAHCELLFQSAAATPRRFCLGIFPAEVAK